MPRVREASSIVTEAVADFQGIADVRGEFRSICPPEIIRPDREPSPDRPRIKHIQGPEGGRAILAANVISKSAHDVSTIQGQ